MPYSRFLFSVPFSFFFIFNPNQPSLLRKWKTYFCQKSLLVLLVEYTFAFWGKIYYKCNYEKHTFSFSSRFLIPLFSDIHLHCENLWTISFQLAKEMNLLALSLWHMKRRRRQPSIFSSFRLISGSFFLFFWLKSVFWAIVLWQHIEIESFFILICQDGRGLPDLLPHLVQPNSFW